MSREALMLRFTVDYNFGFAVMVFEPDRGNPPPNINGNPAWQVALVVLRASTPIVDWPGLGGDGGSRPRQVRRD
jgi:hypothetical protein